MVISPVTKGATSIWERWNGYEAAFGSNTANNMNSFNHFALGAVGQWMYEYQLGITTGYAEGETGYKHFILQPAVGIGYLSLSGSYDSNYGPVSSAWTADGKGNITSYKTTVPANTTATLYLPVVDGVLNCESIQGAKFIRKTSHHSTPVAEFELESGTFTFTINNDRIEVK